MHNEGCVLDNGRVCGDGGIQKSTRTAIIDLLYPGKPCEGVTEKEESCSVECPGKHLSRQSKRINHKNMLLSRLFLTFANILN